MPKIFYGYILRELIESFVIAMAAYTFVMGMGVMFKSLQAGLGMMFVFKLLPYAFPQMLMWTVPISLLTASVIAYGRLSSDNEVLAMNALGLNPLHLVAPAILLACAISVPMLISNHIIEPKMHEKRKATITEAALKRPFAMLSLDNPVLEMPGLKIYIGEATDNQLKNVVIFSEKDVDVPDEKGGLVRASGVYQVTYAAHATYQIVGEGANRQLLLTLYDVEFKYVNRAQKFGYRPVTCKRTTQPISLAEKAFEPGWKDMTTPELMHQLKKYTGPKAEPIEVGELNEIKTRIRLRWANSFDPISLALLGVALGLLTRKGRKLVGFGVSVLVVVVVYFPLVVSGKALSSNGVFPAPLWPWSSVVVVTILGLIILRRQIKV